MSTHADPVARYTDGAPVLEGDQIRYHQKPGGILPAGDWKYGVARILPWTANTEEPEMAMEYAPGRFFGIISHVVERAS